MAKQITLTVPDNAAARLEKIARAKGFDRQIQDPADPGNPAATIPDPAYDPIEEMFKAYAKSEIRAARLTDVTEKLKLEEAKETPDPVKVKTHLYDQRQLQQQKA